jgi:hypothetical protein
MLGHLEDQTDGVVLHFESVQNGRELVLELYVDNGTNDLSDTTDAT